jgi:hypothetical protein
VAHGHATLWTVLIDPPNSLAASITFGSQAAAKAYKAKLAAGEARYAYIIPPKEKQDAEQ